MKRVVIQWSIFKCALSVHKLVNRNMNIGSRRDAGIAESFSAAQRLGLKIMHVDFILMILQATCKGNHSGCPLLMRVQLLEF
jgi:hypothetical protein